MKVLLNGANGFIGRQIELALQQAGHQVVRGVSRPTGPKDVAVDFGRDTQASTWLPRLGGVHAVINAVGILRGTASRPIQAVHADAPIALFQACAQQQVRRVLHISALGIDGNDSPYATTKRQAEQGLLQLTQSGQLQGLVLRPSMVFGPGGDSSELFLTLSKLPVLVLPGVAARAKVQPVHVLELAAAAARLLTAPELSGTLNCVGPQPVAVAELIASLRQQQGRPPAPMWSIPDWLSRWSAAAADLVPVTPWGRQALSLLSQDNVADPHPFAQVLGRSATGYADFLSLTQQHDKA